MKCFLFYSSEALYAHWIISAASNSKRLHWRSIILNRSVSGVQFSFCIVLYCICICICEPYCMRLVKWLRCAFQVTICAISLHYPLFIFPSKPPLSIFTTYPTPFTPFVVKTVEPQPLPRIIISFPIYFQRFCVLKKQRLFGLLSPARSSFCALKLKTADTQRAPRANLCLVFTRRRL